MKLFTKTFGCQMNFADSDEMGRHLKTRGFTPILDEEKADAVLVNTCTVRDLAEHKAGSYIGRLKEWKLSNPDGLIIVTGCAAERAKADFKRRFPHIDLIVGAKDIETFPREIDELLRKNIINEEDLMPSEQKAERLDPGLRRDDGSVIQYVTVMRGCNYNCSYCIVPSVRGREVYLPIQAILDDVKMKADEGAKEIWLLGQTVNSYRPATAPKPDYDFSDLLRDVNKISGVERIRFMSPHPFYLTEKLIDAMKESDKVCEHIHLPVQSGSNKMLSRMKRNYTREIYLRGIENLRSKIPSIAITTDIIVGFPGETDEDYAATKTLVAEAGFDSAYCFKYSPRPGTVSAEWEDDVSVETKEARVNDLLALTDNQGAQNVQKLIGSVQEVLIEEDKGDGVFRGKTRTAWKTRFKNAQLKVGDVVQAEITATHSRELHGTVIPAVAGMTMYR